MINEENAKTVYQSGRGDDWRQDLIRTRAHEIWAANGCIEGHDLDDWLQAEEEFAQNITMVRTSAA